MKSFIPIICLLLVACQHRVTDVKDFMPGTYTRFSKGQFSQAWDTLVIGVYEKDPGTYVIRRRTGYQRIRNGKMQRREYKKSQVFVILDEQGHQLQDLKTGVRYLFAQGKGTVLVGSAEYVQVK